MLPFNFSMGVMTLFIAVGIAASLAKHHNLDSLTAGMLSLMSFLLVAAPLKDGQISTAYFSGQDLYRNSGGDLLYRAVRLSQTPQHYDPSTA